MAKFVLKNPGFELGDRDWTKVAGSTISNDAVNARSGVWVGQAVTSQTGFTATPYFPIRPGLKISASAWWKHTSDRDAASFTLVQWFDKDKVVISQSVGSSVAAGTTSYTLSTLADAIAVDRAKSFLLRLFAGTATIGTAWVDDALLSGALIESLPLTAVISGHRIVPADTIGVFDSLIGTDKFTEFNAGMSDKWSGVYTFIPSLGANLGELVSFIRRLGRTERFFAFDPDRVVPLNGIVNGMRVDGPVTNGTNKIPVKAGPVSTTALVAGDYMEVKDQYFQLQRDLEIGPEGTGEAIVWPSVRSTLANGEDVITDNPKMVARITSDLDWRRIEARPVDLTISWAEV